MSTDSQLFRVDPLKMKILFTIILKMLFSELGRFLFKRKWYVNQTKGSFREMKDLLHKTQKCESFIV